MASKDVETYITIIDSLFGSVKTTQEDDIRIVETIRPNKQVCTKIVEAWLSQSLGLKTKAEFVSFFKACDYFHQANLNKVPSAIPFFVSLRSTPVISPVSLVIPKEHCTAVSEFSSRILEFVRWIFAPITQDWDLSLNYNAQTLVAVHKTVKPVKVSSAVGTEQTPQEVADLPEWNAVILKWTRQIIHGSTRLWTPSVLMGKYPAMKMYDPHCDLLTFNNLKPSSDNNILAALNRSMPEILHNFPEVSESFVRDVAQSITWRTFDPLCLGFIYDLGIILNIFCSKDRPKLETGIIDALREKTTYAIIRVDDDLLSVLAYEHSCGDYRFHTALKNMPVVVKALPPKMEVYNISIEAPRYASGTKFDALVLQFRYPGVSEPEQPPAPWEDELLTKLLKCQVPAYITLDPLPNRLAYIGYRKKLESGLARVRKAYPFPINVDIDLDHKGPCVLAVTDSQ